MYSYILVLAHLLPFPENPRLDGPFYVPVLIRLLFYLKFRPRFDQIRIYPQSRARASQRGPATRTRFIPRSILLDLLIFLSPLFTIPSHMTNVRVRPRVFAGRTVCLRRRDGGSSLNAAAFLTSVTQHPLNNNAFPLMRCPNKRRRLSSLRAARQDISICIYTKRSTKKINIYVCIYRRVCEDYFLLSLPSLDPYANTCNRESSVA